MDISARVEKVSLYRKKEVNGYAQLVFPIAGQVNCLTSNRCFQLSPDTALLIPISELFEFEGEGDEQEVVLLEIPPHDSYLEALKFTEHLNFTPWLNQSVISAQIGDFGRQLVAYISSKEMMSRQNTFILRQSAILLMAIFFGDPATPQQTPEGRLGVTKQQVDLVIDARIGRHISNEELAELLHISNSSMTDIFKKLFGVPPQKYVASRRLEWARFLIQNRGDSLVEVAYDLGFSSQSVFCRAFKRHFGYSPKVARRGG
ncbi:AraC family transcriptional regulator [Pseudomonas fulva]|uniref:AraC family transcriptional regulator n=1 Tax=Pseudomonas fulva TaxID=47880 RepID=UPI00201E17A9|nr:AraC family transcriptional regulator [Pseudomonas fulva]UQY33008.1 AraC family transcriptional regulator [Pseudomonas fulva]